MDHAARVDIGAVSCGTNFSEPLVCLIREGVVDCVLITSASHNVPLKAAAIQFPFTHPAVSTVLLGCRSAQEIASNVADLAVDTPPALWSDFASEGLIAAGS